MSTVRKMLEAKKANILSEAEKAAAEVDRDMVELERLAEKYGIEITDDDYAPEVQMPAVGVVPAKPAAPGFPWGTAGIAVVQDTSAALASTTSRARVEAEKYIRLVNRPVPLSELYDAVAAKGVKFESANPRNTLSAVLGQGEKLYSISRDKGWWVRDLPEPNALVARRI